MFLFLEQATPRIHPSITMHMSCISHYVDMTSWRGYHASFGQGVECVKSNHPASNAYLLGHIWLHRFGTWDHQLWSQSYRAGTVYLTHPTLTWHCLILISSQRIPNRLTCSSWISMGVHCVVVVILCIGLCVDAAKLRSIEALLRLSRSSRQLDPPPSRSSDVTQIVIAHDSQHSITA